MPRTDTASRRIDVPADRVFAALVDPEALAAWLPPAGMTGRFERFELREGGSYRMVLTYDDPTGAPGKTASDTDVVDARFVQIVPGRRLVQETEFVSDDPAFSGTMTLTWEVSESEGGALVEVRAAGVPEGISPEEHAAGLASSLDNLAVYVATGSP